MEKTQYKEEILTYVKNYNKYYIQQLSILCIGFWRADARSLVMVW
jgi:hypothetical protein